MSVIINDLEVVTESGRSAGTPEREAGAAAERSEPRPPGPEEVLEVLRHARRRAERLRAH